MLLFATNFQNDLGTNLPDSRLRLNITGANHQTSITTDGLTTTLTLEPNVPATINGRGFTPSAEVGFTTIDAIVTIPTTANLTFNIFGLDVIDGKLANGIPFPKDATIQAVVDQDLNCTYYINGVYVDVNSTATFDITAINKGAANTNATIKIKHLVITFQQDATPQQANISLNKMQVQSNSDWSFTGEDFLESIDKSDSITDTPHAVIYKNGGLAILSVENPTALTYIESAGYLEGSTSGTLTVNNSILLPQCTEQSALDTVILGKVQEVVVQRVKRAMIIRVESLDVTTLTVKAVNSDLVIGFPGFETTLVNETKNIQVPNGSNLLYISGFAQELEIAGIGITEVLDFGDLGASRIAFSSGSLTSPNLVLVPSELPESITSIEDMFRGSSSFTGKAASGLTGCSGVLECTIADWNVRDIENMDNAFNGTDLNVDLSSWDVEHIPIKPEGFDSGVTGIDYKEPRWGVSLYFKAILEPNSSTTLYVDVVNPDGMIIDWGDGSAPQNVTGNVSHYYSSAGTYEVKIDGKCSELIFSHPDLTEVLDFGVTGASRIAFYKNGQESRRLTKVPDELPRSITNMYYMFAYCSAFNQPLNFDTSNVTNMYGMFYGCSAFNQPLNFDTSNVTNMNYMFYNCRALNQPLNFDTSNVTNMNYMFYNCRALNQPLNFDTSNVTTMEDMFAYCSAFNQPLNFDTSNVTNMSWMFYNCSSFNQPLNWDTSNVTNMSIMFSGCSSFNQDLSGWCVQKITSKPHNFDNNTPSGFSTSRQPRWGQAC